MGVDLGSILGDVGISGSSCGVGEGGLGVVVLGVDDMVSADRAGGLSGWFEAPWAASSASPLRTSSAWSGEGGCVHSGQRAALRQHLGLLGCERHGLAGHAGVVGEGSTRTGAWLVEGAARAHGHRCQRLIVGPGSWCCSATSSGMGGFSIGVGFSILGEAVDIGGGLVQVQGERDGGLGLDQQERGWVGARDGQWAADGGAVGWGAGLGWAAVPSLD